MIVFNMCLINMRSVNQALKFSEKKSYDSELDDETSVIFDICDIFEQTKQIKFLVSGFGQDEWPVNCRFDLPGIIEELPEIINKISQEEYNFKLNFYEQGVERELIFQESGQNISLTCLSRTNWIPTPNMIEMNKEKVKRIFNDLYENFIFYSTELCPSLIKNPLLFNWLNSFKNE
ncbi:hypothetical protein A0J52_01665 [Clostridium sporogenes]|uniref:hypothetical protein n=1 Tax=Clostridium sporogenes TaxID=1509 RepID=UPI00077FFCE8|nr:hypothetical protein [Clostridium sporogenes]KYN78017.1 hypothetical protein A0J52_01665 [Clostridium sporogenes]